MSFAFEQVMLIADRHDAFLIDLSGKAEPVGSTGSGEATEVTAEVEGIDKDVRFRLVELPDGSWRIRQVLLDDGNESWIPWAVPTD